MLINWVSNSNISKQNPLKIIPLEVKVLDSTEMSTKLSAFSKSGVIHLRCFSEQTADFFSS